MSKKMMFITITFTLLLTGCASDSNRGEIDWQFGARRGVVAQFYTPETPIGDLPECLATVARTELAGRRFVRVDYKHIRHLFSTTVEVPTGAALKINQQVEVWPDDCSHGKFGRIGRIFPADPAT